MFCKTGKYRLSRQQGTLREMSEWEHGRVEEWLLTQELCSENRASEGACLVDNTGVPECGALLHE